MKTKSELANRIYKDIASDKKAKILKVYKGKDAVQKIKKPQSGQVDGIIMKNLNHYS